MTHGHNSAGSWRKSGTSQSGRSAANTPAGNVVVRATHRAPAERAARTLGTESSITTQPAGSAPAAADARFACPWGGAN